MKEEKNIELTKEHLSEVTGGAGMKGDKGGKDADMARCPHCGAEKDVYYKPGKKITCSACGKEFEI